MKPKGFTVVAALLAAPLASGAIIYSENFNGLTPGSSTLEDSGADWSGAASQYGVVGPTAPFSSNSLNITTTQANFNFANWENGARQLLSVSFDIVDPGTMTVADAGVRIATSRVTSNGSLIDIVDGTIADNEIFHYDIITNITGSAVLYEDGVNSVGANSYDVWVNGVNIADDQALVGNGAGDIDGVGIWARRPDSNLLMDNIAFRDTAYTVPEPSVALLGGLGLLGLLRRRRA